MVSFLLALARVLLFEPSVASHAAAWMMGDPSLADDMVRICRRESLCHRVGVHEGDAWAGETMWRKAMKVGWLDENCPFHQGQRQSFAPRGPHGLSAAYSLRYLGACLPPATLDIPLLSAVAAVRRSQAICSRYGACDREGRRRFWAGARNYDSRSKPMSAVEAAATQVHSGAPAVHAENTRLSAIHLAQSDLAGPAPEVAPR